MQSLKARDVVQAKVKIPAPSPGDLHLPVLAVLETSLPDFTIFSAAPRPLNHSPPREVRPLYHLDCALLI